MFHWICPECGREIAPTVRECPACDEGAEQAELVLAGVVEASARTLPVDVQGTRSGLDGQPPSLASSVSPLPEPVKWTRIPGLTGLTAAQSDTEQGAVEQILHGPSAGETDVAPLQNLRFSAEPLIPEILDAKAALDRVAESKASMRGMLDRAAETWANQPNPADGRVISTRTIESRTVGTRASGTKVAETNVVETKAAGTKLLEAAPVDAKPVEAKPIETKPIETKPVETKPIEAKPIEVRSVETEVSVAKPVEATAQETDAVPANDRPIETQPAVAPQFDRVPLLAALSRLALPRIAATTVISGPEKKEGIQAGTEGQAGASPVAPGSPSGVQASVNPAGVDMKSGPDVRAGVTPEVAQREPLLPTFAPAPLESLNALLAAASVLAEEPAAEGATDDAAGDDGTAHDGTADVGKNLQPDPPVAGKLPLRAIPSAGLPVVAPAFVSIGAVEPRALPTLGKPKHILAKHILVERDVVEENAPATAPEQKSTREIAGLRLVESRFPLTRPKVQAPKFAAVATPVPAPPKSGAVRAPRSAVPFLAPNTAGLVKYSPLENRPIIPVPPPAGLRRSDTASRITLPGPMLTRALVSFRDRELTPIFVEARAFRKRFAYGWLAVVLAAGTVLGVGFSSMVSPPGRPPVEARAASEASPAADGNPAGANPTESAAAAIAPVHAIGSNPLSKALEVTGFRIVLDPTRKPQVQYLVVNHSPARFPDATIYVSLRTADAHVGQAPLCRFSFAAPDLGPYEAKEMISAIEKTNRTTNLPEWQDLRAEIEIGK